MTGPRRRWSFKLRTLFVLVTVCACWLGYSVNWIRQRHELLASGLIVTTEPGRAPLGLWILGEEGFKSIDCLMEGDVEAFSRLFPEAQTNHFEGCILRD
jgi:hypothetical protein